MKSTHRFIDAEEKEHVIKIYGTNKSKKNLSNKDFTHFFVDSTYKCIPNNLVYTTTTPSSTMEGSVAIRRR